MPKKRKKCDFCKNYTHKTPSFATTESTTDLYTYGNSSLCTKNIKHYIEQGQDATLRGAKDDLNLKENKTNTSRKKLKSLTEDSNQQPVQRKKKRNEEESTKTTTAKQRNPTGMLAPNINS
jgi:hypothetical protein